MNSADFTLSLGRLRATDSNSLLRLYDQAREVAASSPSQRERVRAEKALERIGRELQGRKVSL